MMDKYNLDKTADNTEKQGTIKREVATIEVKGMDMSIAGEIEFFLKTKGYDLTVKPVLNNSSIVVAEFITVHRSF